MHRPLGGHVGSAEPPAGGPGRPRAAPTHRAIVVCDQWLGSNAYAGMKALRRAGWFVTTVPEWEFVPTRWRSSTLRAVGRLLRPRAVGEFNAELLRQADRVRAEFLLVFKGTFVRGDTLQRLRERGVRTYCFYPDVSFRAHGPFIPGALPHYDWIFTTKSFGVADLRDQLSITAASVLLHAFDQDLHRPRPVTDYERGRYGCDVSFIGTWSPKKEDILRQVASLCPEVRLRVWGEQWWRADRAGPLAAAIQGHEITGEEYVAAIQTSAVNLGLLSERREGSSGGDRITSRTFHVPACGGFMIHERTDELLGVLREDDEVVCFSDPEELASKVRRYLGDETARARIADRGYQAVRAAHSWDQRIRDILAVHESARAATAPGDLPDRAAAAAESPAYRR